MTVDEMVMFDENARLKQKYFYARDIDFIVSSNQTEKPAHLHGNITIRLDKVSDKTTVYVLRRTRLDRAQRYVTHQRKHAVPKRQITVFGSEIKSKTPEDNEVSWNMMEQDELEGVLDELSRDPMVANEEIRTYTISKLNDGTIEVRHGLPAKNGGNNPSTQDPGKSNLDKEDKEVSNADEETKKAEEETLTKLGSDPQTSDHASESEAHMERKKGSETCTTGGDPVETFVHLEKDRTTKEIKLLGAPEGIKEVELTVNEISPNLEEQPQESVKTEPTSNGGKHTVITLLQTQGYRKSLHRLDWRRGERRRQGSSGTLALSTQQ
ncbi:hypothetical protein BJ322DRAFT_1219765 [Thelephora terrestris]|uniref:Uncharacterized protein n=1 Tax=Thelephora terrestris TaxID=56493 RepID=A0A9P6HBD6_9AGAM|nr:hypothetical protein BJ322DRAFT_1219765 [Thelephora terrestris]